MIKSEIVNAVATATLNQEVDLDEIRKFDSIFHDSDVYGGRMAYFETKKMQGKISIFNSGKMISVGTSSEETAIQELETAKNSIVNTGLISDVCLEPKIRNLVVSVDFEETVNLEDLALISASIVCFDYSWTLNGVLYPFATNLVWMALFKTPNPSPVFELAWNTWSLTANG